MNINEVNWLDGKNSNGQYVLQLDFATGVSFLKNFSYEKISNYYNLFWDCPEVVALTLYDANRKVIATKSRAVAA